MPDMQNGKKSRQFKKGAKASGDAANTFVRVILSYAGSRLGGITECEWERTLGIFKHRCAYTGEKDNLVVDHAIPINRAHCGLHLYGNVVPATSEANKRKGRLHYAEFLDDGECKQRIDQFLCESRYMEKVARFRDLRKYCESQYDAIRSLSGVSKRYLDSLLASPENEDPDKPENGNASTNRNYPNGNTLPITLDPQSADEFKDALLKNRNAYITVHYMDGRQETSRWRATRILPSSNIIGNLRSRPQFRRKEWQKRGIAKVAVSIQKPQDAD